MEPRSATGGRPTGVDPDARSGAVGSGLPDQTHQLIARGGLTAAHAGALGAVGGGVGHLDSTSVPSTTGDAITATRDGPPLCHHRLNSLSSVAEGLRRDLTGEVWDTVGGAGRVRPVPHGAGASVRDQAAPEESGPMSIFQPVSFAARRAFWPSLPMARENWFSGTRARTSLPTSSTTVTEVTRAGERALAT